MTNKDSKAVALYAILSRCSSDFLDDVLEETDTEMLSTLYKMLILPNANHDQCTIDLNILGADIVSKRLSELGIGTAKLKKELEYDINGADAPDEEDEIVKVEYPKSTYRVTLLDNDEEFINDRVFQDVTYKEACEKSVDLFNFCAEATSVHIQREEVSLVSAVIDQIRWGFAQCDLTSLEELLGFIPRENLIGFLPEEEWEKYKDVPIKPTTPTSQTTHKEKP